MNIWYKGPVIERHLREYSPTLPKEAYKIDLFFHHDDGQVLETDSDARALSKLIALKERINIYLEPEPVDKNDQKYRRKLASAKKFIGMCEREKRLGKFIYKRISPLIDTNRIGWKLTRKDYIY